MPRWAVLLFHAHSHMTLRWLFLLILLAAPMASAQAPLFPILSGGGKVLVTPSLIADTTKVAPGRPFTVGVRMQLAPGWHTYWQYPGEAGAAPKVEWQLPDGFRAGEIQWPIPQAHLDEGDLLTYIYEGDLILPVEITPPASLPAGDIVLHAHVRWLVCEQSCIPGDGKLTLTLATGDGGEPANAGLFKTARERLPEAGAPPFSVKWETKADAVVLHFSELAKELKVEFFRSPQRASHSVIQS